MTNKRLEKGYFTFVKGLITEASPFTFPENSSYDEVNFELLVEGSRRRRNGIDFESGYTNLTGLTVSSSTAIGNWNWRDADNNSANNFTVTQIGSTLYFYPIDDILSTGRKSFTVNLLTYKVTGATDNNVAYNLADIDYGKGYLIITHKYVESLYVTYSTGGDTISVTQISILERDVDGIDDLLSTDETPTTLSDDHYYNLINQGWPADKIAGYYSVNRYYPSNAQVWFEGTYTNPGTGLDAWSVAQLNKMDFGNSEAPKGRLLRNAFDTSDIQNADTTLIITAIAFVSGTTWSFTTAHPHGLAATDTITFTDTAWYWDNGGGCSPGNLYTTSGNYTVASVPNSTTFRVSIAATAGAVAFCSATNYGAVNARPISITGTQYSTRFTCNSFFAGRVFFGGFNGKIYFSQTLTDITRVGNCYQSNDPTAQYAHQLLDTDGGTITVAGIGQVLRMKAVGSSLIIFAINGIWAISGGESDYFKATSFTVRKLSSVGMKAQLGLAVVEDSPFFIGDDGIYTMVEDKISGFLTSSSISLESIQTEFLEIPDENKAYMNGMYDSVNKRIVWLYSTDASYTYKYNAALVYDVRLKAFWKMSIPVTPAYIMGGITTLVKDDKVNATKYLTYHSSGSATFSTFNDTDFVDWATAGGTADAAAYLEAGYEFFQDTLRRKRANYLVCFLKRTETSWVDLGGSNFDLSPKSACLVSAYWEFANSTGTEKITQQFQGYRYKQNFIPPDIAGTFNPGFDVIVTKNRLRGNGRVIKMRFDTEAGKDCYLYGWAITGDGGTEV